MVVRRHSLQGTRVKDGRCSVAAGTVLAWLGLAATGSVNAAATDLHPAQPAPVVVPGLSLQRALPISGLSLQGRLPTPGGTTARADRGGMLTAFWNDPDRAVPGSDPFGDPGAVLQPDASYEEAPPAEDEWPGVHRVDDPVGRGYPVEPGSKPRPAPDVLVPWSGPSSATEAGQDAPRPWGCRPTAATQVRLKIDNDLASGEDYGYSSGVMLEVAARTAAHDGWGASGGEGPLCPLWRALGAGRVPSEYVSFRLDQAIYTPENSRATWLQVKDRPYAATLVATLAAGTWLDGQRVRNEVRLGWVGPSVRGKSLQNAVHRVINAPRFQGWAHQLPDEPILEVAQYRVKRWQPATIRGTDLLGHWGMRLGNLQTSAFAGLEWRFGPDLQDDGGTAPLRPGSNEPGEVTWEATDAARWAGFVTLGGRAVLRDLTLDGSTWHDSHRVRRKRLVGDVGAGVSVRAGRWNAQFMWVVRSREFEGQRHVPSFGSLQVGYTF